MASISDFSVSKYKLEEEILPALSRQCELTQRRFKKFADNQAKLPTYFFISPLALDAAIVLNVQHVAEFVISHYSDKKQLHMLDGVGFARQLTSLHRATICGRKEIMQQLMKAGVSVLPDFRGWTALHHASFLGDVVGRVILSQRDSGAQTAAGGTAEDIWDMVHVDASAASKPISVMYEESSKDTHQMTAQEFEKLTGAVYRSISLVTKEKMFEDWQNPKPIKMTFPIVKAIADKCAEQLQEVPMHLMKQITHNDRGEKLVQSPGFGLVATKDYKPKSAIGVYVGKVTLEPVESYYSYVSYNIDAKKFRNEMGQINDGFPNVFSTATRNYKGREQHQILLVSEPTKCGEEFCDNYGFGNFKCKPYVELRPKALRDYIKSMDLVAEVEKSLAQLVTAQMTFEDYAKSEKFGYILSTPAVIFALILDGSITVSQAKELMVLAFRYSVLQPSARMILSFVTDAEWTLQTYEKMKKSHPKLSELLKKYIADLPARMGISGMQVFFIQTIRPFFESFLKENVEESEVVIKKIFDGLKEEEKPIIKGVYEHMKQFL